MNKKVTKEKLREFIYEMDDNKETMTYAVKSNDQNALNKAKEASKTDNVDSTIELIPEDDEYSKDVEVGEVYEGVVEEVVDFGAFVEILPGKTGLLHISELSNEYVDNIHDFIKAGDEVTVKVLEVVS